jgi:Flp pilus assembly protein TadB
MSSPRQRSLCRPGPIRWLWYAFGGRLPSEYRGWVLHDLTCLGWPLRHLIRLFTQLAPIAIVLVAVLPGPLWVRVMAVVGGSVVGLLYSFVFLYEATERRATKAGYPHGTLQLVREERRAGRELKRAADEFERAWRRRRR